ncbi:restriction endonuclease subunit S [Bacillus cereus]|uniref:restriction endonuclease subunit S n=1 Tax=Bacillus cereus TaxID=1396 RepID=UPI00387F1098
MNSGWKKLKIKEFTKVLSGGTPKSSVVEYYEGGTIGWITPSDLTGYNRQFISKGRRNITNLGLEKSAAKLLPAGTVLFSSRAPIGHVVIAENELTTNQGFKNILPSSMHNPKYLYWYLKSVKDEIEFRASGTTFKEISGSEMNEIEIPLPSLEEQTKIVAVLDKAQTLIKKRKEAIVKLDELIKSVFLDMFGDPLTNSKCLPTKKLNDIGKIQTGNTPPRKEEEYYGNHIEWIKSDNINTPYHYLTTATEYLSEFGMKVGRYAPENSILVTCIAGSKECIGNSAIADRTVAFNQQINAITPYEDVNPYFLYVQFLVGKKLVQQASTNGMKGLISKSKFQEISFLYPSYKEQKKFGDIFIEINNQRSSMEKSLQYIQMNFNSLLQRAFKGELEIDMEVTT